MTSFDTVSLCTPAQNGIPTGLQRLGKYSESRDGAGPGRQPRSGKRGLRVRKAGVGLTLNWLFPPRREGAWGLSEYLGEDTECP